jgi:ABC-type spermidine/putrescine transport system permease subunit II
MTAPASDRPTVRPSDRLTAALWIIGGLVFAFIYLPLVVVILYAFHDASIIAWPFQFGTLRWFGALSHDRGMIEAAVASLKLALLAVAIALLIGVPGAFVLDRYARLQRLDRAQEEASQDLYANEWQTFRYVTFPSIRTAVLGAGLLVFTLSLDEIAVTFFLIGRQNTLPLQIWGLLRRGITPEVNAAATVIFALSVAVIVVWARLMREEERG